MRKGHDRRVKLTKRNVESAEPVAAEYRLWDTDLKGFCLRVHQSGRKVYGLKFRVGNRQRWLTIGAHGAPWTPDTARTQAVAALHAASNGHDATKEKAAARAALTVGEIMTLYWEEGPKDKPNKRQGTWAKEKSTLECHVRPLLGNRIARDVTANEIRQMQADI